MFLIDYFRNELIRGIPVQFRRGEESPSKVGAEQQPLTSGMQKGRGISRMQDMNVLTASRSRNVPRHRKCHSVP